MPGGSNGPIDKQRRVFLELYSRTRHSDGQIGEIPIGGVAQSEAVAEQDAKGRASMAPAVPAEHELVEVALQVFSARAMIRAKSLSLEVRKDPVDPSQHQMGGPVADNFPVVFAASEAQIARPSVCDHLGTRGRDPGHEGMQASGRIISDQVKPDAAWTSAIRRQFNRSSELHLADRAASLTAVSRFVLGAVRNRRLVDLDQFLEQGPILHHHGPAELLQQEPGRLVAAEAKLGLQLKRRDAVGVARHDVGRGSVANGCGARRCPAVTEVCLRQRAHCTAIRPRAIA